MQTYTIKWIENKTTSTGKIKADATLVGEDGIEVEKVTIWGDYPNFVDLRPEAKTRGTIEVKQNGQYTNKTLKPELTNTLNRPTRSPAAITKAMETKKENIKEAQDNKAEGIKISSTMRDAVLIVTSFLDKDAPSEVIRDSIQQWREWLWKNWDVSDASFPPFDN